MESGNIRTAPVVHNYETEDVVVRLLDWNRFAEIRFAANEKGHFQLKVHEF